MAIERIRPLREHEGPAQKAAASAWESRPSKHSEARLQLNAGESTSFFLAAMMECDPPRFFIGWNGSIDHATEVSLPEGDHYFDVRMSAGSTAPVRKHYRLRMDTGSPQGPRGSTIYADSQVSRQRAELSTWWMGRWWSTAFVASISAAIALAATAPTSDAALVRSGLALDACGVIFLAWRDLAKEVLARGAGALGGGGPLGDDSPRQRERDRLTLRMRLGAVMVAVGFAFQLIAQF